LKSSTALKFNTPFSALSAKKTIMACMFAFDLVNQALQADQISLCVRCCQQRKHHRLKIELFSDVSYRQRDNDAGKAVKISFVWHFFNTQRKKPMQ
jgi:hypothetical protein